MDLVTKLLLVLIITFLLPSQAFAEDSTSYKFITSMMKVSEHFTLTLYDALTLSFRSFFYSIASIMITIHMMKWIFGKPDVIGLLKLFISLVAVNSLAFTQGVFEEWIYRPIMQTVYALPAFVVKVSAGSLHLGDGNSLKSMLTSMDHAIRQMRFVGDLMILQGGVLTGFWLFLQGVLLNVLFTGLWCVFVVMFTIGIVASHVMLATAPFAITLIAFERLRGLSFNIIRSFFSYSLIPFFVAVAMGMTLSAIKGLIVEADQLLALDDAKAIPETFLMQAILISVFSWFFHVKASEFASQTIGGAISNFGQSFASGIGLAAGATKLAGSKLGAPAMKGGRGALGRIGQFASNTREKMWNRASGGM